MPSFAKICRMVPRAVSRLVLPAAIAVLALPALAQPVMPVEGEVPDPFANSECAAEPITGSGPGFSNSRDASEDAARKAWGEKAIKTFPEANWDTAKDAGVSCVVQGLYSKCFAQAIPCKPKSGAANDGADKDGAAKGGAAKSGDASSEAASSEAAMSDGPIGAEEDAQMAAAPVCKRAMINQNTGVAFCMDPRGAAVDAPPVQKLPPCKPGKHTGEAWTFGPACNDE